MASLKRHLRNLENDLVGPDNRRLFFAWILGVTLILGLGLFFSSGSVSLLGVAEARESQVNFATPVTLHRVHVRPGQRIRKGELLFEYTEAETPGKEAPQSPRYYFAEMDGRISTINHRSGEKVAAFSPVLTLLPLKPVFVNGFVHEQLQASLKVGQKVEVFGAHGGAVPGRVVSLGAKIVPIPDRLLRIPSLSAWGREVVVQIPATNDFLPGEKVSVHKVWSNPWFSLAKADEAASADYYTNLEQPQLMEFPENFQNGFDPEISGVVYVPELKEFLLISDDYPGDKPFLMTMRTPGVVQNEIIPIQGLRKMKDVESISYRDNKLYLLSSMSASRNGDLDRSRRVLIRAQRQGQGFQLDGRVDLGSVLEKALGPALDTSLEVEGHALVNADMYLVLKNPTVHTHEILVVKIQNFENLFAASSLDSPQVRIVQRLKLELPRKNGEVEVTDAIFVGSDLYLASSFRKGDGSGIWKVDGQSGAVSLLQEYSIKHLESLVYDPCSHQIYGIFEGGKRNAIASLKVAGPEKGCQ